MEKLPKFVDMAIDMEEAAEMQSPISDMSHTPKYPYGLCISLCDNEIDKLDLEDDCEIGDLLHMHCLAKVTAISKNEMESGSRTRIELQIIGISCEDEDAENEDAEEEMPTHKLGRRRPY